MLAFGDNTSVMTFGDFSRSSLTAMELEQEWKRFNTPTCGEKATVPCARSTCAENGCCPKSKGGYVANVAAMTAHTWLISQRANIQAGNEYLAVVWQGHSGGPWLLWPTAPFILVAHVLWSPRRCVTIRMTHSGISSGSTAEGMSVSQIVWPVRAHLAVSAGGHFHFDLLSTYIRDLIAECNPAALKLAQFQHSPTDWHVEDLLGISAHVPLWTSGGVAERGQRQTPAQLWQYCRDLASKAVPVQHRGTNFARATAAKRANESGEIHAGASGSAVTVDCDADGEQEPIVGELTAAVVAVLAEPWAESADDDASPAPDPTAPCSQAQCSGLEQHRAPSGPARIPRRWADFVSKLSPDNQAFVVGRLSKSGLSPPVQGYNIFLDRYNNRWHARFRGKWTIGSSASLNHYEPGEAVEAVLAACHTDSQRVGRGVVATSDAVDGSEDSSAHSSEVPVEE